jgi:hypothetical protein
LYLPLLMMLAMVVYLFYAGLAHLANTTTITVDRERLTVRHHPLPWPGNRTLPTKQIKRLRTQRYEHRGKKGVSYSYGVEADGLGSKPRKVLGGLSNEDEAQFIEFAIERYLQIKG